MSGDTGVFDLYGFELSVSQQDKADRYACAQYALRREAKWELFVRSQTLPDKRTLKRYVRKGVPPALRGWVWWHTSGAAEFRARHDRGHFDAMVLAGEQRPCIRQIELDLPRTFPRNSWVSTPEGVDALRSVLVAYSAHNPGVGYCQGMNFLAALLLLAVEKDTERCFWLLVALLEGILYPKTYAPNLDGCHVEMRVLGRLLAEKAPKLNKHMHACGCEPSMFATDWFLVLFATTLPAETAARVWDAVFLEGSKVVYRVALTLLTTNQAALMRKDNAGEMLKVLKDQCSHIHNRDKLMAVAFNALGSLPMAKIKQLRAIEQKAVDDMLAARAASRQKGALRAAISQAQAAQHGGAAAAAAGPNDGAAADHTAAANEAAPAPARQGSGGSGGGGGGGGAIARSGSGMAAAQEQAWAAASAAGQVASAAGQVAAASIGKLYSSFRGTPTTSQE